MCRTNGARKQAKPPLTSTQLQDAMTVFTGASLRIQLSCSRPQTRMVQQLQRIKYIYICCIAHSPAEFVLRGQKNADGDVVEDLRLE